MQPVQCNIEADAFIELYATKVVPMVKEMLEK